jgi:hypothetical protein
MRFVYVGAVVIAINYSVWRSRIALDVVMINAMFSQLAICGIARRFLMAGYVTHRDEKS